MEQYEAIRSREADQASELEEARAASKAAISAFNDVSRQRFDLFTAAFDHVATEIDPIFKVKFEMSFFSRASSIACTGQHAPARSAAQAHAGCGISGLTVPSWAVHEPERRF